MCSIECESVHYYLIFSVSTRQCYNNVEELLRSQRHEQKGRAGVVQLSLVSSIYISGAITSVIRPMRKVKPKMPEFDVQYL